MSQLFHEKQISYLYEVGIQGGIRRAADILGINASVISRQISLLERTLQLPLLERKGRTVVLTEAGKLLADDFFESRERRTQLERHLKDLRYMKGGAISIRVGAGLVDTFVEYVLKKFAASYPNVFVEIVAGSMQATLAAIVQGEADMALAFGPIGNPELKRHSFPWGPICAVVNPQHPIAHLKSVTIEELSKHRLISLSETFGLQRHMNAMFQSQGYLFTPAYRCNLFSTAMSLSISGMGISFMSAQAAGERIEHNILVAVPVDHPIATEAQCHLLRNSDRRFSPAAHHLWQLLLNFFQQEEKPTSHQE
ncbi:LysR family transcriptional regulator [Hafnia psychrotolerans]|uniref:LysR family transcriptional regulator n=1 Tax=Hafnia psychrotolerans TaxID=1477018 RepID=A0ABQ1G5H1_9GAMM|nr:LysR family transcriptional regulator [Hafnia psychrotolerans]GGA36647.1 LysR family transcriptional regulator [Hafnia psychrotolerans]